MLIKATKNKERRVSRGPDGIRREQDFQNAARLRASQLSQNCEQDISIYLPPQAPNISSSSSSSSSSFVDNDPLYDGDEDNISETRSPIKQTEAEKIIGVTCKKLIGK
jgi:hypothetical protein